MDYHIGCYWSAAIVIIHDGLSGCSTYLYYKLKSCFLARLQTKYAYISYIMCIIFMRGTCTLYMYIPLGIKEIRIDL